MDDLGVWQKPRKGYAPLGILFNQTSRSDKGFDITERAMRGYIDVAYNGLVELTTRIGRARKRHVGIRVLAGKTI